MPAKLKTVVLPFPEIRLRCAICGIGLIKNGKFQDVNICATEGIAVLTCSLHGPIGDKAVMKIHGFFRAGPVMRNTFTKATRE